jgi:hypothetical protein
VTRSRWLDFQPATIDDRLAELVVWHHLGEYRGRPSVQRRLDELFATNPTNVEELLLRACDHLGVTGHDLERLGDQAVAALAPADNATTDERHLTPTGEHGSIET